MSDDDGIRGRGAWVPLALAVAVGVAGCPGDPWEPEPPCEAGTWYADGDGDGVGDGGVAVVACVAPARHVAGPGDCDDADAGVFPGAVEACNGVDDDCDGKVDEDDDPVAFYVDADGDGWGVEGDVEYAPCGPPTGYAAEPGDCDDDDPRVHPGADDEPCDELDRDCDGHGAGPAAAALGTAEFAEIQDAIDAAVDGDAVYVCPGRHFVRLEVPAMELTLGSWSGDPDDTVLDGEDSHPMLLIDDGADVVVEGLGFENGRADHISCREAWEPGALLSYAEHLVVRRCRFTHNMTSLGFPDERVHGTAMSAVRCHRNEMHVEIEECLFEDNGFIDPFNGSASTVSIECSGSPTPADCMTFASVTGSTFLANRSVNSALEIGGWGAYQATLQGLLVMDNESDQGATVEARSLDGIGWLSIEDSTFLDNRNRALAAAMPTNRIERCWFEGNVADGGGTALNAGGVTRVYDSVFVDNHAVDDDGGAIDVTGYQDFFDETFLQMTGCLLEGNVADRNGGAIKVWARFDDVAVELLDTIIADNHATLGGGISTLDQEGSWEIRLEGGAIRDNTGGGLATAEFGPGIAQNVLFSDGVDWGEDGLDNTPFDIDTGTWSYDGFGAGERFTCAEFGPCTAW